MEIALVVGLMALIVLVPLAFFGLYTYLNAKEVEEVDYDKG